MLDNFLGFQIFETLLMVDTFWWRRPRSKKKRIQDKWRKKPENWRYVPQKEFIISGNKIFCHPVMANQLKLQIKD